MHATKSYSIFFDKLVTFKFFLNVVLFQISAPTRPENVEDGGDGG